jgi:hypothetical protein
VFAPSGIVEQLRSASVLIQVEDLVPPFADDVQWNGEDKKNGCYQEAQELDDQCLERHVFASAGTDSDACGPYQHLQCMLVLVYVWGIKLCTVHLSQCYQSPVQMLNYAKNSDIFRSQLSSGKQVKFFDFSG